MPVAEHHDGFQMYRSALSKWNAFDMGPHDVIGELAEETKNKDWSSVFHPIVSKTLVLEWW